MRKKAQVNIGMLILAFVGVIVGIALMVASGTAIASVTNSYRYNVSGGINDAITCPADGVTIDLLGQELLDTPVVINATGARILTTGNYTIDEGVSTTTGLKTIRYTAIGSEHDGISLNITYLYGPDGYIESGATRSIVGIILIFMALGIALIAIDPALRSGILDITGI